MSVIFPVIMCGGSGTRLWPASRPSRPKQFIPLAGNRSPFQETVERVADLAGPNGRLIVIGGVAHRQAICEQLKELGRNAIVLLEPQARDSAAAMAAAAIWTKRQDPEAVNLFVASDHHIPDGAAFRDAVRTANEAASAGRIVTFGVVPSGPSSAYGYIAPRGEGLAEVEAFVEKPDVATSERYIANGYLWNSGNFIVRADVLKDELRKTTAGLIEAVTDALDSALMDGGALILGRRFGDAPRISIDYAVMEKTRRASVLPVAFDWSDLGAWDAVHRSGEGDVGLHLFEDAENCLVRACDGVLVAAVGVSDLAIVVERDAVLVTDLARSQDVRKIVKRLEGLSPRHLDFPQPPKETLEQGAVRFAAWMRQSALPTWCTLGQNAEGGFEELLSHDGRRLQTSRRAVVQVRQLQVYAEAGRLGWSGPWRAGVTSGLDWTHQRLMKADGRVRTRLSSSGAPEDETTAVYDQAFLLFALAGVSVAAANADVENQATRLRDSLMASMAADGGVVEVGAHPYQANAHMHLLEAALAWEDAGGDASWMALADRIVHLARSRFIDPQTGMIREFFSSDWSPAKGSDGSLVEPGHQFEWAWLLARHAKSRDDAEGLSVAWRLFEAGLKGIDPARGVVIDAMNLDGSVRSARARLWPQTEWLKASLILASLADDRQRDLCLMQAARAQRALWRYLTPVGLWHDKMLESGDFIDEPAPASSLYHIMAAYGQVRATVGSLRPDLASALALS
ncbi:MAG: AGE family epimerase/isomerase [Candidatus Brevundimonas colombiensis]|uniref:AGE family epimerase/isomerase n=1 Tax=Candidatus Brevundimonas colombiensis TaxID=3121376 RepID=A0AAJ5X2F8_9CAUL|nr:AGE family epimerase/isomerase [Brevundimonas sp.]WEK40958.1 MAG: AGE family epimerase/isomerase [Brevundimonas sp.]